MNILACSNFQNRKSGDRFIFQVSAAAEFDGGGTVEISPPPMALEDPDLIANDAMGRARSAAEAARRGLEHVEGGIPNVTEENFQQEVLGAPGLVVVDFYADWCQPCRRMGEIMESTVNDIPQGAQIKKLDVEAHRNIANQYNIEGIPAVIFFRNGQEVSRFTGVQEREEFISNVERISRESPETSMLRARLDSARSRADGLNINTRLLLADIERDTENATEDGKRVLTQTACMRLEAVVQSETDARNIVIEKSRDFIINHPRLIAMIEETPDDPFILIAIAYHIALPYPPAAKWSDVLNAINALPQGTTEQTLLERRFQNLLQMAENLSVDTSTYPTHFESQEDQRTAYRDLGGKLRDEMSAAGRVLTRDMDYFRDEISSGERRNMNLYDLMINPEVRAQVATRYGFAQTAPWSSIESTIEAATAPATHIDASFPTITHNL